MKRSLIFVVGILASCAAWKLHTIVEAQQSTLTFPDVITPSTAQSTALIAWKDKVEADLQAHEARITKLEAAQAIPPAPTTFSIPVTQAIIANGPAMPLCGSPAIICNSQAGETLSFPLSLPGNLYTLSVTGAGPGTLSVFVNGVDTGLLLNFPMTQTPVSVKIVWPGGSGMLSLLYKQPWANLSGNLTLQ
jgi:hypothetical protein